MENLLDSWGLTAATFVPMLGVALMMFVPKEKEDLHKKIALATSLVVAAIGVLLLVQFDLDATGQLQFAVDHMWIDVINSHYAMGLDGMSLPLVLLTMLVVPLCIVYSWDHFPSPANPKAFLMLKPA